MHPRPSPKILAALLALALLSPAGGVPEAGAQGIDVMRSTGRSVERTIRQQVGRALRPTLEIRNAYPGPPGPVALSPDQSHMAVVTDPGGLRIFDLINGREVVRVGEAGLARVALGSGGRPFAALGRDGSVRAGARWGDAPGTKLDLSGRAPATAIAAGAGEVLVGHADGSVTVWEPAERRLVRAHDGAGAAVGALVALRDGAVAAGDAKGVVAVLDAAGRREVADLDDAVTALSALSGGRIGAGTDAGRAAVIDPSGGRRVEDWRAHRSPVTAVAPLGDGLVTGAQNGEVTAWEADGDRAARIARDGRHPVTGLATGGISAARILASGPDKAVRMYGAEGEPLMALYLTRRGWGAVDERGRFDGDEAAFEDMAWTAEALRLPVDNLSAKYFEPGLLLKHLNGTAYFLAAAADPVPEGIYPPPEVAIEVDGRPSGQGEPIEVVVRTSAEPLPDPSQVRLFHNGKRVGETALRQSETRGGELTMRFWVPAVPGDNVLRAVAEGWADIESLPAETRVELGASDPGRLHLTSVGINDYKGREVDLNYSVADARAITALLPKRAGGLFSKVESTLLLDGKASRGAVMGAIGKLADVGPEDTAVVFLSGHARMVGERWYYLPHELVDLADDRHVGEVGISDEELVEALVRIPARRLLLVVDSCQSGAVLGGFESFGQRRALHLLNRQSGVAVIAATRADQLALEYGFLGHGLLTYVFLEGMEQSGGRLRADAAPADGRLTVTELKGYVEHRAPELAKELDQKLGELIGARGDFSSTVPVTPVGTILGDDFVLAR